MINIVINDGLNIPFDDGLKKDVAAQFDPTWPTTMIAKTIVMPATIIATL